VFEKILIANRGEIACRVARAARALEVKTVAVYSDADANALHVRACDEAVRIGPAPARDSYLDGAKVIAAAKQTGAQAIHPGYGFLSEQAEFAQACAENGIVFVGPPPAAMRAIKDKAQARIVMRDAYVPVAPGSEGHVTPDAALDEARALGFPLLVKAAGGGGGIGMQVANDEPELVKAVRACSDRARASFGKDAVYLERYFPAPRHVEVPIGEAYHRPDVARRRSRQCVGRSPEHRFDPCQQLTLIERLDDVIVGPELEAHGTIRVVGHSGEHDDRHMRCGAQPLAQAEAVFPRQHHVEDHEIYRVSFQGREHGGSVRSDGHPMRMFFEEVRQ